MLAVSVSYEIKACICELVVVCTCVRAAAMLQFPSGSEREQGGGVDTRPGQFNSSPWQGCVTHGPCEAFKLRLSALEYVPVWNSMSCLWS